MTDFKGTFLCYERKQLRGRKMELIRRANQIIHEYEIVKGIPMSLRQLHYQITSRDPVYYVNEQKSYDDLSDSISDGRIAGLVSWTAIEDRNRQLMGHHTWNGPSVALKSARDRYKIDMWHGQNWRPEVWVEKAALEGVLSTICNKLRVDFFATRGYNSQSEMWRAGQRFANYIRQGQRPIIFHLGDHDPSGINMTEDIRTRIALFTGSEVQVVRLALNWDQVQQYKPPPNYAKETDSRTKKYHERFGTYDAWELDALPPEVIQSKISDAIMAIREPDKWDKMLKQEVTDLRLLDEMIDLIGGKDDGN